MSHIPVVIKGYFMAHYNTETGKIDSYSFTPHASDAGHFGSSALQMSIENALLLAGDDEPALDVESTDGPFWKAVQGSDLDDMNVLWTEDGPHADGSGS